MTTSPPLRLRCAPASPDVAPCSRTASLIRVAARARARAPGPACVRRQVWRTHDHTVIYSWLIGSAFVLYTLLNGIRHIVELARVESHNHIVRKSRAPGK